MAYEIENGELAPQILYWYAERIKESNYHNLHLIYQSSYKKGQEVLSIQNSGCANMVCYTHNYHNSITIMVISMAVLHLRSWSQLLVGVQEFVINFTYIIIFLLVWKIIISVFKYQSKNRSENCVYGSVNFDMCIGMNFLDKSNTIISLWKGFVFELLYNDLLFASVEWGFFTHFLTIHHLIEPKVQAYRYLAFGWNVWSCVLPLLYQKRTVCVFHSN